jgi:parallel beta-helix repeat protein
MVIVILVCLGAAFFREAPEADAAGHVLYVAPDGDDGWSGTAPVPPDKGYDGPFATLRKARDAIRELRRGGSVDAFTVLVRGGTYELKETLVLGPEDSGTESEPLIFKAFGDEHPILRGTRKISGFKPYRGQIWKADAKDVVSGSAGVEQLFVGDKAQIMARYPNQDPSDLVTKGFLYVENPLGGGSRRGFTWRSGTPGEWVHSENAEVFIYPGDNWTNDIRKIAGIDRVRKTITLSADTSYEIKQGNRFFVRNVLEELDSPGEWYFDRGENALYFWPTVHSDLDAAAIPVLGSIIEVKPGKAGNRSYGTPSHIKFEGLTLDGCRGNAVVINGASDIAITGSTVRNAGGHGIEINGGSRDRVAGNEISQVGSIGVKITGGDSKTLTPAGNVVENNDIHDTGTTDKGQSAISCRGVGSIVAHNLIHSIPRVGIWFDGNDHLIEYNHIYDVNRETEDSGTIYSSQIDWTKRGTVVRFNFLHDSGGYGYDRAAGRWQKGIHTYGIYLDAWTSGTSVYGNIITNTANGGIFIHGGRDNRIENNIIIEGGRLGQMVYSEYPLSNPDGKKWIPIMFDRLQQTGHDRYPELATIKDAETGAKCRATAL